ncbi:MAG: glucoamylase family protein [Cyclobacteriaceae bacterium]
MKIVSLRIRPYCLFIVMIAGAFGCADAQRSDQSVSADTTSARISDDSLFNLVQYRTFQYFWDGAEPNSGMAAERIHMDGVYPENDQHVVTIGGSGFGVMAILVGIERGYITREAGRERLQKIADFLAKADRFHGAWPHWLHGETGKVKPFSPNDDGGDLVETAFIVQGLIAVRQYFADGNEAEQALASQVDQLWKEVEWDWYTKGGENILYWHWSPNHEWAMNFGVEGYNECLIMYVLAASSPTHTIAPEVYHEGWARGGDIEGDTEQYGMKLALKHNGAEEYGGPLFWSHYSYLGLDPRNLKDRYADYWQHNTNHVLIDWKYCTENPYHHTGYSQACWGLTASYSPRGYAGHKPGKDSDLGVISPTAALSSFPYTPEPSMMAMRHFYDSLGDKIWGEYGFYDAFSQQEEYYPTRYLAIDQGPIVVMMENHRSGLLWELFMSAPEVQQGLKKLGFQFASAG